MGLTHMQYAQTANREHELQFGMNPHSCISFLWMDGWAKRFSGQARRLDQPPASGREAPSRERGCPFPGEWPSFRPIPFAFFCFSFAFFCFFVAFFCFFFAFFLSFLRFLTQKYPKLKVPNLDRGPPRSARHLPTCTSFPSLPLPSPFPSLPLPSPSFPSLPLSSPPFSSPSPQSLSIPFLLLSLPSLPSSYPSPSPSPRPQVSRLRALVFLTSNPLAQELCYAHVLSKRRGPWSEPDLSLPDQLHASSMQRMSCHSHNVTAQCTEVPLLWVAMTCCKFHLLSDILLNSCWYCSFPFRISCFPSLLCRLYYPVQADLLFRFVLHVPCSLFPGRISRNVFPQVMCVFFQLALVLSNCSAFVTCASFRLSSFATMFSLRLTFFNSIFFAIVMFAFLKLACFIRIFFAIVMFAFLKLACFIRIFLQLSFLPFSNLHFSFAFFLHLSFLPFSELHFSIPFFLHCFCFFSSWTYSRTSAIRQHNSSSLIA